MIENRKISYFDGESPYLKKYSWSSNSSKSAANIHGLIDEVENATWRTDRSSFATKIGPNCRKMGLRDGFGSSNMWHLFINWKNFFYIGLFWEETSLTFLEFILIFPGSGFQKYVSNKKFWDPKIRSQIWIWFSQYVTPVKKLREVIVLWTIRKKTQIILQKVSLVTQNHDLKMMTFHSKNANFGGLERPEIAVLAVESGSFDGLETILKQHLATGTSFLSFLK